RLVRAQLGELGPQPDAGRAALAGQRAAGAAGDPQVEPRDRVVRERAGPLAPGWVDQGHAASARRTGRAGSTVATIRSMSSSASTRSASASYDSTSRWRST